MATIINANQSQANESFNEISNAAADLAQDELSQGRGDKPIFQVDRGTQLRHEQNGIQKSSWIMTTTEWKAESPPRGIVWNVNPGDITWNMAQRSVHTKNLFGTVLHVWPDTKRNTFYDEFRLTFNLQSGNLLPVKQNDNTYIESGGVANFYDFMQLVDAPKLTVGTASQPPRANLVSITYVSNLFPKLTLIGMFDSSGIRFTDSSQDPNQVNGWSIDFIVYDTFPKLSDNTGQQLNTNLIQIWIQERVNGAKLARNSNPRIVAESAPSTARSISEVGAIA